MATSPDSDPPAQSHLSPDDPLIFLALRTLARELDTLQSRLPPQGLPPSPEQIHRMRIAVRRIRVALRLFGGLMPKRAAKLRAEFRWLGRALGEVRDLDVLAQSIGSAQDLGSAQRIASAQSAATDAADLLPELDLPSARAKARARLARVLEAPRFAALTGMLRTLVERKPAAATLRRWKSLTIRRAARDDVRASLKRVLRLGRKVGRKSPPERLHRLRLRVKRLRYETEFYVDFDPALRPLAKRAKRLQDVLGAYRDAGIAAERLQAHARRSARNGAPPDDAVLALIHEQNRRAADARARFAGAWRAFERTTARTKLTQKRKQKRK